MKLSDYFGERGRQAALSRALKLPPSLLSAWASGDRPVPISRCCSIEVATDGAVSRRDLREDWADHWPELAGDPAAPRPGKGVGRKACAGTGG